MEYNNEKTDTKFTKFATRKNNPYGHINDFVNLSEETQGDAHKVISPLAAELNSKGKQFGTTTDVNGNTYDFEVFGDSTYRVTNVEKLKDCVKEVASDRNPNKNSRYSMGDTRNNRDNSSIYNESDRNRSTSDENVEFSSKEQKQQKDNGYRLSDTEQEKNNKGLDNSSFFKDNQGRKLTEQQTNYFKDSKIRNKNGNKQEIVISVGKDNQPEDKIKIKYDENNPNEFYEEGSTFNTSGMIGYVIKIIILIVLIIIFFNTKLLRKFHFSISKK